MLRTVAILAVACAAGGCSMPVEVYGVVGDDNEIYVGTATARWDRPNSIQLSSPRGTQCLGDIYHTSARAGRGRLSCSDGQQVIVQFTTLSWTSGYGSPTRVAL